MDLNSFCSRQIGTYNILIVVFSYIQHHFVSTTPPCPHALFSYPAWPPFSLSNNLPSSSFIVSPPKSFLMSVGIVSLTSSSATVCHIQLSRPLSHCMCLLSNSPIYHAHRIRSVAVSSSTSLAVPQCLLSSTLPRSKYIYTVFVIPFNMVTGMEIDY